MITLENNQLVFRFPEVHPEARGSINFQRTLRIPDDGNTYPLPPGMGSFPLHHVEDYANKVPPTWRNHGGVFMPMYQSEALWISLRGHYPIALQIAAGKINAVNGEPWQEDMQFNPQGYVVTGKQPWLEGFCVEKDIIRQFVAAPLGKGITVEEQVTGKAEFGGIQIKAWPLKREVWEAHMRSREEVLSDLQDVRFCLAPKEMGLGMGGRMRPQIYKDKWKSSDWDQNVYSRCFIHLVNSAAYSGLTGHLPPHKPYKAKHYTEAGLPWFDYYKDRKTLNGSSLLRSLKSTRDFKRESDRPVQIAPSKVVMLPRETVVTP